MPSATLRLGTRCSPQIQVGFKGRVTMIAWRTRPRLLLLIRVFRFPKTESGETIG